MTKKEVTLFLNHYSFKLRAENGHVYHDDLKLVFAELPKFQKGESELINDLDRWFYFLKSASTLEAIPKSMTDNHAIQHAFRIANKAGLNRQELDDQEHREIFIQDQRGALSLAKKQGLQQGIKQGLEQGIEQGLEQGIEQGLEQGIEQGEHTAKLAIAQSLLDLLDDQAIASSTGLTLEQVQQLRQGR
jgi:predicted transposase/invertase (TIGR01784 family)